MSAPNANEFIRVQGNKQYLPVPQRVQWFRGERPDWTISTSVHEINWSEGYAIMRAEVLDDTGRLIASGMKTETRKGFGDFVEKAETGAVGRALARAGYGTEDALDLEGDRFADAPIEQPERGSGSKSNTGSSETRSTRVGGANPPPAVTPAPAQYRRAELAQLLHDKHLGQDDALRYAAIVGIPEDERPMSDASMDRLIDAIKGHGTDAVIESAASPPAAEESSDGVVPSPVTPPKPGTPEYGALKPADKASARAYWSKHPDEEPTLAEQLAVPA